MLTLYQFPISHFCEKVRWALDYKQLDYRTQNLLPGLHAFKTKRLAKESSVPILKHRGITVQGSMDIVSYLDTAFLDKQLTPASAAGKSEALEWENYADKIIGPHVRRMVYDILLNHPEIVKPFFAHQGPWFSQFYLNVSYPHLTKFMRKGMKIHTSEVLRSHQLVQEAVERLGTHMQTRSFMVGDEFSRADIAIGSLLAPLVLPEGYGLNWPDRDALPDEFQALLDHYAGTLTFVEDWYRNRRHIQIPAAA